MATSVYCSGCGSVFATADPLAGARDHALDHHSPDEFARLVFTNIEQAFERIACALA